MDHYFVKDFQAKILAWFKKHGRQNLPWQKQHRAYDIWVSEIMLQQTQVSTVIPYYRRFMEQFPDLNSLANAPLDQVLSLWSGLGYYARARHLHRCAQIIMQDYQGQFPDTLAELMDLPGIGRSTAGAILAFAFGQQAPILDGNVKRVLARIFAIEGWPGEKTVQEKLWEKSSQLTPKKEVQAYTQAMMDIGALICKRSQPLCQLCPASHFCQAYQNQTIQNYPGARPKKVIRSKETYFLILLDSDQRILMEKRPPSGIWGGLWSLPELGHLSDLDRYLNELGLKQKSPYETLASFEHRFTHFHLQLHPLIVPVLQRNNKIMENPHQVWYKISEINKDLGLPQPIKKLLENWHDTHDLLSKITT